MTCVGASGGTIRLPTPRKFHVFWPGSDPGEFGPPVEVEADSFEDAARVRLAKLAQTAERGTVLVVDSYPGGGAMLVSWVREFALGVKS